MNLTCPVNSVFEKTLRICIRSKISLDTSAVLLKKIQKANKLENKIRLEKIQRWIRCCFNVEPPSMTVAQHWNNNELSIRHNKVWPFKSDTTLWHQITMVTWGRSNRKIRQNRWRIRGRTLYPPPWPEHSIPSSPFRARPLPQTRCWAWELFCDRPSCISSALFVPVHAAANWTRSDAVSETCGK